MLEVPGKLVFFAFSLRSFRDQVKSFFLLDPLEHDSISSGYAYSLVLLISIWAANFAASVAARMVTVNVLSALWDIAVKSPMRVLGLVCLVLFYLLVSKLYSSFFDDGSFKQSYFYVSMLSSVHLPLFVFVLSVPSKAAWKFVPYAVLMGLQGLVAEYLTRKSIVPSKSPELRRSCAYLTAISCAAHVVFYALVMFPLLVDY